MMCGLKLNPFYDVLFFFSSVKFVGLFVVLYVGYTTAMDLWRILGNLKLSIVSLEK